MLSMTEVSDLADSNGVNFYEQILYLIIVNLGETRTIQQIQQTASADGIVLSDYLIFTWKQLS